MDLHEQVARRGGLAATHELLAAGITSHSLTQAVRAGRLLRLRQGWYGLPGIDQAVASAVRVGGRATCISAAVSLGLWGFDSSTVHVRVDPHSSRLRTAHDMTKRLSTVPSDVRVHWRAGGWGTRYRLSARDALIDMIGCQSPERVVAAADSALRLGLLSRPGWERMIRNLPERHRTLLSEVDAASESILESILRFRLRRLGYLPRLQVEISGVGRVDLLLGDRLVIELDGWEHHHSRESFEADRRRDAELARRGFTVLRFTYRRVTRDWPAVLGTIRDCSHRQISAG
ncbi:hypothetical protein BH09ACT3_BH09ACT3_12600 [soil metagenome]